ncbi:MAG: hypothetical protein Q9191_006225 [Dirinaria sp. TL-2023a]
MTTCPNGFCLLQALGSSGAWVLLGAKLCGYVIAVRQDIPWAYMVAIEPVMRDIGRMFKTDDVRLPTATEIRSLTASSKALTAGPRDVLGEDDRSSILAGGRAGTSEQILKAPWQVYVREMVTCPDPSVRKELPDFRKGSELRSELPELESSELELPGLELPSPRENYQAAESGYQAAWHDENKTERANATSLEARPGPKLTPLPVQEATEPVGEKVTTPAVTSQPSLASMEKGTELAPEPQQTPSELRSSNLIQNIFKMVNWSANIDALLFKHVLKLHDIKPNYVELEKALRAEGVDATAKAITHRIGKIRSTLNDENKDAALGPPVVKRRGPAAGKASKRDSKGSAKKVVSDETPHTDENEDEGSPKKKQKRAPRKKAVVKDEEKVLEKNEEMQEKVEEEEEEEEQVVGVLGGVGAGEEEEEAI